MTASRRASAAAASTSPWCALCRSSGGSLRPGGPPATVAVNGPPVPVAGKSSVGYEVSAQLRAVDVGHALIEGDVLDHIRAGPG
ncbi:hypothetical protein GCM10009802_47250 [Streptomyces synnematoformans]|uniref:Uncharacterized protein n=1 Tax=Streptomyces synnematoformans TaxID=415721 RepID=A0ABN2Z7A5_9ACTN